MAKYYCILFDADNTLLDFDAAENKALAETLVEYGIEPDAETVQTYRTINEELCAEGTVAAIDEVKAKIVAGEWDVFDGKTEIEDNKGEMHTLEGADYGSCDWYYKTVSVL